MVAMGPIRVRTARRTPTARHEGGGGESIEGGDLGAGDSLLRLDHAADLRLLLVDLAGRCGNRLSLLKELRSQLAAWSAGLDEADACRQSVKRSAGRSLGRSTSARTSRRRRLMKTIGSEVWIEPWIGTMHYRSAGDDQLVPVRPAQRRSASATRRRWD